MIETLNLSKSFGKRKIIDGLNLKVEKGDIYGFLGPNGSGKTTTIKMLLGLIYPDTGIITINGYDMRSNFNKAINRVGAIVESPSFFNYMTGYQNIAYISGFYKGITRKQIEGMLDIVNLSSRVNDKVGTYSLGMKQRLGIAATLINNPNLIILDEPTNGLDPHGMKETREMIKQLAVERGISFFISSHILHEVEQICTKFSVLKQGKLIAQGKVQDLLESTQEVVEIITSDREKCCTVVKGFPYAVNFEYTPKGITIRINKGFSGSLLKYLVSNNISVKYLIPQNQSLEDAFMELMGGK